MKNHMKTGIILIGLGAFFIYWAETHSPKKLGNIMGNALSGSYTMNETSYYICFGIGVLMAIGGVLKILKKI